MLPRDSFQITLTLFLQGIHFKPKHTSALYLVLAITGILKTFRNLEIFKAEKLPRQLQDRRTNKVKNKDITVQYKKQNSSEKNISE